MEIEWYQLPLVAEDGSSCSSSNKASSSSSISRQLFLGMDRRLGMRKGNRESEKEGSLPAVKW
uniref:Uncharacterized protein n=1 Tax=Manihot esculenta TaxID=3983 RepID=A0A251K387_MANES